MNFTVYSKHGCPYCTKVLQVLSHLSTTKGYSVVEYVLDTHFTREQFYDEFGQGSTFPQVILNDSHLGGCSDTVKYLKENNII
jgi:glutaredoxin 3